ncbi:uncharacterized protein LOC126897946, partial [Daktulosphaira vitifoliae]|uniref:uncharacterized protein LOC126897946 n=1 Tax=Daktulosphaira vitifoliae TaxID=58002 RepID=UPI0021AAA6A4
LRLEKKFKKNPTVQIQDPQTHNDFSFNLDACIVQATKADREAAKSPPGVVERAWIMSRPPTIGRGVEPTVTARRAYVMQTHVQGQMIDTGELVCKKVCNIGGATGQNKDQVNLSNVKNPNRQSAACGGGSTCD